MAPEIRKATDRIFCHYGPFFALLPRYGLRKSKFFKMKKKRKKKRRKPPEDIIILQMCTINDNHIMYGSGDMECNGQNFLSFSTVFYSFTPLKKLKPFEKLKKKRLEISSFSTSLPKIMIICYTVLEIWCVTDVLFFILGYFLHFYPP